MKKTLWIVALAVFSVVVLGGCSGNKTPSPSASASSSNSGGTASPSSSASETTSSSPSTSASASPTESALPSEDPVVPEKNPAGDIPDSQAFVPYKSQAGGYSMEVPEGWARSEQGQSVRFVNKLDGVQLSLTAADQVPTADSLKANEAAALEKNGRAVKINKISEVKLPKGKALKISYTSNSEPHSVTGKQVRLENEAYYYFNNKKLAVLTLWAPLGADNVDQWKRMSESFGWDTP
jgi:cytoskeletal protein RodZ